MMKKGVYIHIPFCSSKCPYCDFYSMRGNEEKKDEYLSSLLTEIDSYTDITADTVYIGGGTPSVFGEERLKVLIEKAKKQFRFSDGEITVEINSSSFTESLIKALHSSGVNRISMGLQSSIDEERKILGRNSTCEEVKKAVDIIKKCGIENISLDVMLGVPNQTQESLKKTLDFCIAADVQHISAYILKIEENTLFYRRQSTLDFPDEDSVCDLYEFVCEYLENHGFYQYEISNFSRKGYESRHNLKYWKCEEYLGLGAASHSFLNGKRFYHERNFEEYKKNPTEITEDGEGGSFSEFAMLKLRLTEGINNAEVFNKFGHAIPEEMLKKSQKFITHGLMSFDGETLRFTRKGFLLSNTILAEIT